MFLPGNEENGANSLNGAALATDDPAHIMSGHANLEPDVLTVRILVHLDLIRFAYQSRNYSLDRLFHRFVKFAGFLEFLRFVEAQISTKSTNSNKLYSAAATSATGLFLIRLFTVSVG